MRYGDLTSLYQLGVALNFGFGAVMIFGESARKQLGQSIFIIENKLVEIAMRQETNEVSDREVDDLYQANFQYLNLMSDTKNLMTRSYAWESVAARVVYIVGGVASFVGLTLCSWWSGDPISGFGISFAVSVNTVPMISGAALLGVSCWFHYKIFPRLELLQRKVFKVI